MHTDTNTQNLVPITPIDSTIDSMVTSGWIICNLCLWSESEITKEETVYIEKSIRSLVAPRKDPWYAYLRFCQKVQLSRSLLINNPGDQLQLDPKLWFKGSDGLIQSNEWLTMVDGVRKNTPSYRLELKAFAEAIVELVEAPMHESYEFWSNWFTKKNAEDQVLLFDRFWFNYSKFKL